MSHTSQEIFKYSYTLQLQNGDTRSLSIHCWKVCVVQSQLIQCLEHAVTSVRSPHQVYHEHLVLGGEGRGGERESRGGEGRGRGGKRESRGGEGRGRGLKVGCKCACIVLSCAECVYVCVYVCVHPIYVAGLYLL